MTAEAEAYERTEEPERKTSYLVNHHPVSPEKALPIGIDIVRYGG